MNEITEELRSLLKQNHSAPFLFVGSGFSRRYIGLEQWNELLEKFCLNIKSFGYYLSKNNGSLPSAASDIARDFNEFWWSSDSYADSRQLNSAMITSNSSALKLEISNYLLQKRGLLGHNELLKDEISALSRLNVDGIITTNWDTSLEDLFPDYKVFIGQEELLFSNPQSIAEIYKIHGCSTSPSSLILTKEDYELFESRNSYLAAKLITIFIEHPVIFIGYSLSDSNIKGIIKSIVTCLGQDKIDKFSRNLIFLQRCKENEGSAITDTVLSIDNVNLKICVIRTNNYLLAYNAIEQTRRKIPARVLRFCKEQMYDIVKVSNAEEKISVIDIDQIDSKDSVEFVVGVGIIKEQENYSRIGYDHIRIEEIFNDFFLEKPLLNPDALLESFITAPAYRSAKYVPIYRYLTMAGINSIDSLKSTKYSKLFEFLAKRQLSSPAQYVRSFDLNFSNKSTSEIIAETQPEKAAFMIALQDRTRIQIDVLENFLLLHKDKFCTKTSSYSTQFRRLACLLDYLKFGFE